MSQPICIVIAFCEQHRPKSPTEQAYLQQVRLICRWYECIFDEPLKASDISPELAERYQAWARYRLSRATLRSRLSALRWLCDCLIISNCINHHPLISTTKSTLKRKRSVRGKK